MIPPLVIIACVSFFISGYCLGRWNAERIKNKQSKTEGTTTYTIAMTKCFVEPAREQLVERILLHWDGTIPLEYKYGYEPVRGVQCDPKAPACKEYGLFNIKTGYVIFLAELYGDDVVNACCDNCYFCHEVKE